MERREAAKAVPATTDAVRRLAFESFTQGRLERAYRWAAMLLRDRSDAQDAVHDAMVQAWIHWDELRDPARIDAWFDRILLNVCRMRMRGSPVRSIGFTDTIGPIGPDPIANLGESDIVNRALATLDADHRIAVVLRYGPGLSPREIALRTGQREGTIKSRLHYALRQLRAFIDAAERTPGAPR